MSAWLDELQALCDEDYTPQGQAAVASLTPDVIALARQLGEALRHAADWSVTGNFHRSPTRLQDNERIVTENAAIKAALAAFREATEDR